MTIQKAIASGKPFRRPHYEWWIVVFQNYFFKYRETVTLGNAKLYNLTIQFTPPTKKKAKVRMKKKQFRWSEIGSPLFPEKIELLPSAILADDWEVKEDK